MKIPDLQLFSKTLQNLSKREKAILYGTAFIVLLTVLDRMIITPVFSKMVSLNEAIKEKESRIKTNLHIMAQKDKIISERSKYSSFLADSKSEQEDMSMLLKEVENTANSTSVYLIDLKPVEPQEVDLFRKYLVNLNCEGEMEQIIKFMYNIENAETLLTIERYQITPKSKESSVARCSMTISKIVIP